MNIAIEEPVARFEGKLYRRVESIFSRLDQRYSKEWRARMFLTTCHQELSVMLGIGSMHLYEIVDGVPEFLFERGETVQKITDILKAKLDRVEMPWFEKMSGRFAAIIPFQSDGSLVFAFFTRRDIPDEKFFCWAVSSIHYAIIQNNRQLSLHNTLEQATDVQRSLLPSRMPVIGQYSFSAKSVPAKVVGGDVYDFHQTNDETLLMMIADAAGHGLPAALQARDVITGLRMGIQNDVHLTLLAEQLNRVIHASGLASRFVSVVLTEFMMDGSVRYVNAGHPPPLLLRDGRFTELVTGGMILGFAPNVKYNPGYARMKSGDQMVFYSDGLVEHASLEGEEFGKARLQDWTLRCTGLSSDLAIDALFQELKQYGGHQPIQDDATTPYILKVRTTDETIQILESIPVTGIDAVTAQGVTGIPNLNNTAGLPALNEPFFDCFGSSGEELEVNAHGLDSEGIVRTSDGTFWVVEEYGPSILKIASDGKVIKRFFPHDLLSFLSPITGYGTDDSAVSVPEIYGLKRKLNRGFEGIGLSPDEDTLYIALQSPLINPTTAVGNDSRNTRILAFDIASEQIVGEYVYRFQFTGPGNNDDEFDVPSLGSTGRARPRDMKISALAVLDDNRMLVLERTDFKAKIFLVDLRQATNILGTVWDNIATNPSLETLNSDGALESNGVTPLLKQFVITLDSTASVNGFAIPQKLEGMTVLDGKTIAIANDNDFGVGTFQIDNTVVPPTCTLVDSGRESQIIVIRLDKAIK